MWSSKGFLARCERLKGLGFEPELEPGLRVARKFADLGIEEFLLLPSKKIVSLFTGQVSELVDAHLQHLFAVPSTDQLVSMIQKSDFDLEELRFVDQREWEISIRHYDSGECHRVCAGRLDEALADAYSRILEHTSC